MVQKNLQTKSSFLTQSLIDFEKDIAQLFEEGKIMAPIHLHGNNEQELINIFKNIKPNDWVFSTHRSHYHMLLKGVPKEWVKAEILAGRSIHLNNAKHKFFTSAIVGGVLPIALGVALATYLRGSQDRVWAFVGDMAGETGMFYECSKYACYNDLPITFVIEDNGLSVETPTKEVWGTAPRHMNVLKYKYERTYPHQGGFNHSIF